MKFIYNVAVDGVFVGDLDRSDGAQAIADAAETRRILWEQEGDRADSTTICVHVHVVPELETCEGCGDEFLTATERVVQLCDKCLAEEQAGR